MINIALIEYDAAVEHDFSGYAHIVLFVKDSTSHVTMANTPYSTHNSVNIVRTYSNDSLDMHVMFYLGRVVSTSNRIDVYTVNDYADVISHMASKGYRVTHIPVSITKVIRDPLCDNTISLTTKQLKLVNRTIAKIQCMTVKRPKSKTAVKNHVKHMLGKAYTNMLFTIIYNRL